ncbi:MAG: hypothetical protein GY835_02125 [bacterium]|nr:hypothetical protein [bacterium]
MIASLSLEERGAAIAYIERRIFPPGETLPWAAIAHRFDEAVVIAFVDLEPALNWTHRGRYLILGVGGGILREVEADRPPFLTGASPNLCLIHQGDGAPDWAVATAATV